MQAIRLISTKDMPHDEWLEWRKKGIGGSDVAAICGMSRYRSPVEVYLDKLGDIPPIEDNPKMAAGRRLEPFIADWFAEDTGYKVWRQNYIFQHPEHEFMFANIDRWLPGMNAGLEIKNTSEYGRDDWSGTQAPTEYILQCNHYMAVTGADRWFIAVLIGGWDFQWRVIERDDDLISNLVTVEREFWQNHVLAKVPPAFSHQDTARLSEMYPTSQPVSINLAEDVYPIIQQLYEARKAKVNATEQEVTAKNQIKAIMGEAECAYWQGDLAFTWKSNAKGTRVFNVIGGND
ncbi:YqaJ viral recombinase family protein [Paenibacillus alvei]|uniref:YqaJ viral recombinase family nuclease n=1 Tax=Paenibacillus alvei TaxID=44250 RepID=UPI0016572FC6|nr:YqaJ viral recombinase family protein [Paenibacillus alvei]MCY9543808.1 YqaJ viral recombinase family protein [Paenibacillus alvei]MCY9708497.1 YqaJ viral recombinase family protein [Paenibacillus alvei]MCY9738345.1 YqaJ viral recombinase family protein [Paenibacillus alvei]MCY9758763.1 YqaJ viral recombinase family protein [Paenibacillus alvei]MEC0083176.1 YqaJ viral recombinase family protein [Paenibacillus alvei]